MANPGEQIIDVVDCFDPRMLRQRDELTGRGGSRVLTYFGMSAALHQLVSDVKVTARSGSLNALRIWGHGTPGVAGLAIGEDPRLSRLHLSGFSRGSMEHAQNPLWEIKPYFAPGGRIEFRTCQTGGGADGEYLAKLIATKLGVHVYMSIVDTYIQKLDWVGPVLHCDGQGRLETLNPGQAPKA